MNSSCDHRAKCALLVLCGLPGSGKTTVVARIREHVKQNSGCIHPLGPKCNLQVVTFDDWLHNELLSGEFSSVTWQRSRQAALKSLLELLEKGADNLQDDAPYTLLIADDNHHLRSMRYELFRAARNRGAAFLQLYLPCSPAEALVRNQRRSGVAVVPPDALQRMATALEPPHAERFAWESTSLVYHPDLPDSCGPDQVRGCSHAAVKPDSSGSSRLARSDDSRGWAVDGDFVHGEGLQRPDWQQQQQQQHQQQRQQHDPELGEEAWDAQPAGESRPVPPQQRQLQQQPQQQQQQQECQRAGSGQRPSTGSEQRVPPETHVLAGDIPSLCAALWRTWGPAPPPPQSAEELQRRLEEARATTAASHLHALDLRSRRVLGRAVAAAAPAERGKVAQLLNEQRRALLQAAREALLRLPLQQLPDAGDVDDGADAPTGAQEAGAGDGDGVGEVQAAVAEASINSRLKELEAMFLRAAEAAGCGSC